MYLTKRYAFSLVEMLVAVILITLLVGVAVFALKYELIAIHKTQKIGINRVIIYNQVRSSLQSIRYYIVDNYDNLGYPMEELHPFFKADQTGVTFITQNPLFSKDVVVADMRCEDNRLTYKEEKLYGNIDFLKPQLLPTSRKKTFYDNLDECSFSYVVQKRDYERLNDKIPSAIIIKISKNKQVKEIYVNVKSDYNRSIGIIQNAIYLPQ